MTDVVEWAKANPGKLTFSGAGLFVGHHIAALQLEKAAGVSLAYIPNNAGGAGAMKAVIAGDVMGGVNNLSDAFRAREAGNVRFSAFSILSEMTFCPMCQHSRNRASTLTMRRSTSAALWCPGELHRRSSTSSPPSFRRCLKTAGSRKDESRWVADACHDAQRGHRHVDSSRNHAVGASCRPLNSKASNGRVRPAIRNGDDKHLT